MTVRMRAFNAAVCIALCSQGASGFVAPKTTQQLEKSPQLVCASASVVRYSTIAHGFTKRCRNTLLKTSSSESVNDIIADDNTSVNDDQEDFEEEDSEPWVLRQITFLGLTAPNDESINDTKDGAATMEARNLSDFLMEIGACSVSITDSDKDTDKEDPLFDEPSLTTCVNDFEDGDLTEEERGEWAIVIDDVAAGRNLWKRCDVSAHFASSMFDVPSIVDAVRYTFHCPSNPRFKIDDVPDRDWIKHVQESWNPIVTRDSKFVLRFPWHEDMLVMKACQDMEREKLEAAMAKQFSSGVKREGAVVHFESYGEDAESENSETLDKGKDREYVQILLEGGIAFGTGEHPTTRLCLDWVRDKVEKQLEKAGPDDSLNFIDYGAGSGVLGIAAAAVIRDYNQSKRRSKQRQFDAKSTTVVGVEIDADAIHIADDNARKNQVDMKNYLPHYDSLDGEALSVVMRAMQKKRNKATIKTLPEELNGPIYDLCAANILASPLCGLAPTLASLVKSGGEIGLSGILAAQADSVLSAYQEFFDDVIVAETEGGWVLITGTRK